VLSGESKWCMGVYVIVFVGIGFEIGVAEWCGVALRLGYECVWRGLVAD
jgi:hypothetical protein